MNPWITLTIVALTYIGIALGGLPRLRVNRTTITLIGVGALLAAGQIDFKQLGGFLDRGYGTLSAGQRTRVSLAKALLNRPEVLLLDEPTASLDPDVGDRMRSYLEAYQRESHCTMLLATHNMGEVERMCTDVVMLRGGLIVDRGAPADLIARYGRDNMEQVFLDVARKRPDVDEEETV